MTKARKMRTGYGRTITTFAACFCLSLMGSTWAEEGKGEQPLRLELALGDGSRVIGVPSIESVPVETSYARMDVPLKQIRAIEIDADHERASLDLQNGDKLSGVINLAPIKLQAIFGDVEIGIEHVKSIGVVPYGGVLTESLKRGLVLYYSFDRDESGKVTNGSGSKNDGEVKGAQWTPKGKVGGAYEFDGLKDYIELGPTDLYQPQGELSGCAWVFRQERGILILSNYRGGSAYKGQFSFGIEGEGHLDVLMGQGPDQYVRYLSEDADLVPMNEWHHIAFSYNERLGNGHKIQLYVDGKVIDRHVIQREGTGGPVLRTGDRLRIMAMAAGANGFSKGKVDEIMLFNRALSAEDVRQIHAAQK